MGRHPKRKRHRTKNRRVMMHPHLWVLLHAPPRERDDALWCDVCDKWKPNTYRLPPRTNQHGLTDVPSFRICHSCLVADWDGNGAELIRQTAEWRAAEEAYLSLITDEHVEARVTVLVKELCRRVEMPGFRKGHAPPGIIRDRYRDLLVIEAMEELLIARMKSGSLASHTPANGSGRESSEVVAHPPVGTPNEGAGESGPFETTAPRGSPVP